MFTTPACLNFKPPYIVEILVYREETYEHVSLQNNCSNMRKKFKK